jgi:hypothetical protein
VGQVRRNLRHAADVARDDGGGPRTADCGGLAAAKVRGNFGLLQVVRTRGAAAEFAVGYFYQGDIRDGGQQSPWFGRDALGVGEVASVVVGDEELWWS